MAFGAQGPGERGCELGDEEVVRDGTFITSCEPDDLEAFSKQILFDVELTALLGSAPKPHFNLDKCSGSAHKTGMDERQAERVLALHWPGVIPQARREDGRFVVRLMTWPPKRNPEMEARSIESYEAAVLDLATWSPPLKCNEPRCVLCGRD